MNSAQREQDKPNNEDACRRVAQQIRDKSMLVPALLFLSAHRPLAFVAGQFLHGIDPLVGLFDVPQFSGIAELLSSPDGVQRLEELLHESAVETEDDLPMHSQSGRVA